LGRGSERLHDAGHNGLLGTPNAVLILNQLEKLPLNESKRFLDVLEEWNYKRRDEENDKPQDVKVKIIFTTNIPLVDCANLAPDMKNRLMIRRATLPPLKSLTEEERRRDLRLFVTHWCRDHGVILEPGILELLATIDLSQGSFRTLRGILELSRFLALSEFGLQKFAGEAATFNVNVGASFFREAMRRSQVDFIKAQRDISEGVPRRLVCLVAIWISHGCNNSKTYAQVREGEGTSSSAFNDKLKEFRHYFTSSESAWAFFLGPETARDLLGTGDLEGYLDQIGAAPETDFLDKLF